MGRGQWGEGREEGVCGRYKKALGPKSVLTNVFLGYGAS